MVETTDYLRAVLSFPSSYSQSSPSAFPGQHNSPYLGSSMSETEGRTRQEVTGQCGPLLTVELIVGAFSNPQVPHYTFPSFVSLPAPRPSHKAPHLVGHQPLPFFLSLKIEGENVIPEGQVRRDQK